MIIIVAVFCDITSNNLVGADVLEESAASIFYTEEKFVTPSRHFGGTWCLSA
jgi:hypothetical protein